MKIEYIHASKSGNGAKVAEEFKKEMVAMGATVNVHHIRQVKAKALAVADLYVFSSPGRMGKPIGAMRRFLGNVTLPVGTEYALLSTELGPRRQRTIPIMHEILDGKGLVKIAEDKVFVAGIKGPLEKGWQQKVHAFGVRLVAARPELRATLEFGRAQ